MNDPKNPSCCETPAGACPQCDLIERRFNALLWITLVMSVAVTLFLYAQARMAVHKAEREKPILVSRISSFRQEAPQMQAFLAKLVEYGKTHPDFAPILAKWGISVNQTAAAPAPAPAAPKK